MDVAVLISTGIALFWVYKLVRRLMEPKRRGLWEGSVPADDDLREWYKGIWWQTYDVIAPEHRVNHQPTPHLFVYQDHHFLPMAPDERLIGWWSHDQRAIFVTRASQRNINLIRHECAHDIMNSIHHSDQYFSPGTYVMKQFE